MQVHFRHINKTQGVLDFIVDYIYTQKVNIRVTYFMFVEHKIILILCGYHSE